MEDQNGDGALESGPDRQPGKAELHPLELSLLGEAMVQVAGVLS